MKLFLLRHAKARDTWPDAERELSEHGIGQVEKLAAAVDASQFYDVVQIWHSPYEAARLVASLSCFGKDLMIVSHNPFLENLADILLAGTKRGGRAIFDKCTLASLTMEEPPSHDIEYGLWALDFLISPKIIR